METKRADHVPPPPSSSPGECISKLGGIKVDLIYANQLWTRQICTRCSSGDICVGDGDDKTLIITRELVIIKGAQGAGGEYEIKRQVEQQICIICIIFFAFLLRKINPLFQYCLRFILYDDIPLDLDAINKQKFSSPTFDFHAIIFEILFRATF